MYLFDVERLFSFLDRSPDILDALKNMASRCFRLPSPRERCLQLSGVTLSSPLTFFVAFLQSMETLKESGELKVLPGQLVTIIYVDRVTPRFYTLYFELKTFTVGKTVTSL